MECGMCGEPCAHGSELCQPCSEYAFEYIHPNEASEEA